MPAHVDDLFSAAYDRMLRGAERERFDDHIASCESCHDAYDSYRAAVDAVRSLPQARMPVAVHLPDSPPVAARPRLWDRLTGTALRLRLSVAALAVVIAAAVAGSVVLSFGHAAGTGSPAHTYAAHMAAPPAQVPHSDAVIQGIQGGSSQSVTSLGAMTVCGLSQKAASAPEAGIPAGFTAHTTVSDQGAPGGTLTLAATAQQVSPGQQIAIYARLSGGSASTEMPCVALTANPATAWTAQAPAPLNADSQAQNLNVNGSSVFVGPATAARPPLTIARPTFDATTGVPLQAVTIPSPLRPGTIVQLVATIPAGTDGRTTPLVAVLTLTVG